MMEALKMVDKAVLGGRVKDPGGMYNILKKYKPDTVPEVFVIVFKQPFYSFPYSYLCLEAEL